jgi:hypothetical protein
MKQTTATVDNHLRLLYSILYIINLHIMVFNSSKVNSNIKAWNFHIQKTKTISRLDYLKTAGFKFQIKFFRYTHYNIILINTNMYIISILNFLTRFIITVKAQSLL